MWTYSSIVLIWIQKSPSGLKKFVANRIAEIQVMNQRYNLEWHHVPSKDNSGDILSRGVKCVKNLISNELWWSGPKWLPTKEEWPNHKKQVRLVFILLERDLLCKISSMKKLTRVMAYCGRFITNCQKPKEMFIGPLTVQELERSRLSIVYLVQQEAFSESEINQSLKNKQPCSEEQQNQIFKPIF